MGYSDHLTPRQAANYLGKTPEILKQWRFKGRGPAYVKRGGRIFYPKADLDAFQAGTRVEPKGAPK